MSMTQEELFQRLSGVIPSVFKLHLLKTAVQPWNSEMDIDEVDWPGYAPAVIQISSFNVNPLSQFVGFAGVAWFSQNSELVQQPVSGHYVTVIATDEEEYVVSYIAYQSVLYVPKGNIPINVNLTAQPTVVT